MYGEQDTLPLGLDHQLVTTWDPERRAAMGECLCGWTDRQLAGGRGPGWALSVVLARGREHLDVAAAA